MVPWYVTLVRLVVPFSILRFPFFGIIASTLADMYDWKFVTIKNHADYVWYENWDKVMDLYYWLFALIIVAGWKEERAKTIAFIFFAYRVAGMLLFWTTGIEQMLFFFPNIFENFFIFYIACLTFSKKRTFLTSQKRVAALVAVLLVPKLVHEYFQHILFVQPWEVWNVAQAIGLTGFAEEYFNYLLWGIILYSAPVIMFFFFVKKKD